MKFDLDRECVHKQIPKSSIVLKPVNMTIKSITRDIFSSIPSHPCLGHYFSQYVKGIKMCRDQGHALWPFFAVRQSGTWGRGIFHHWKMCVGRVWIVAACLFCWLAPGRGHGAWGGALYTMYCFAHLCHRLKFKAMESCCGLQDDIRKRGIEQFSRCFAYGRMMNAGILVWFLERWKRKRAQRQSFGGRELYCLWRMKYAWNLTVWTSMNEMEDWHLKF